MAKILYLSDSPTTHTGFARVSRKLLEDWMAHGHEVKVLGCCYQGEPHRFPYEIIGSDVRKDYWCVEPFKKIVREWRPDVFFTLFDPWMVESYMNLDELHRQPWIGYFPIDGTPIPRYWLPLIDQMDEIITFSRFGHRAVSRALPHRNVHMIYHGVDLEIFRPLPDRDAIRKSLGFDGKFVVGCVARNQMRKNIPALFTAFAAFAKNRNDTVLLLRMSRSDVGWNLDELTDRYDLWGKVFIVDGHPSYGVSDEQLVRLYNAMDLMVLPTNSEGFGLPIIEAQACSIPVLVTDFSACPELVQSEDELIKPAQVIISNRNIEQAVADTKDLERKLLKWYTDWKTGKKMFREIGSRGRKFVEKEFDWNNLLPKFREIIDSVLATKTNPSVLRMPRFYQV